MQRTAWARDDGIHGLARAAEFPPLETARGRRGVVDPSQPSAEPFRGLRLALELRRESRRGNVVVFTSANPGEGKSTIASNYAVVAALNQQKVLLIDGDLRHPALHETFRVPRAPGVVDVLGGEPIATSTRRVRSLGHLELLPAGRSIPGVGDLMSSKRMHEFVESASSNFDLVIIDTPPVLSVSDAASVATRADADVVLIVDRKSRRRAVTRALRELDLVGANVVGIVLNHEGSLARYGYGYGYGYDGS
ncbi:MAG: CpsD/CapB family tyrosine-protein kinase [Gaiellaceae bacterium]